MGVAAKSFGGVDAVTSVVIEVEEARKVSDYPNRYVPIPPNGRRCEWTGLGHAKLYHILSVTGMARRKVRVANLRAPGTKRGQTLFHVGDMLRFLDEVSREQAGTLGVGE